MLELSVVLITKNQAWNISRLIESVLRATSCVSSKEIILVDSASTDETVTLASLHPVNIFRLKPGQRLSPAIGRHVGYKQTEGEYVLFLDGDTELIPGWLPRALRMMRERPDAGGITGGVINLSTSAAAAAHQPAAPVQKTHPAPPKEVLWCNYGGGGVAMYRRSAMERAGTFNPNLNAEEEPELGLRIRQAGYRLFELDYPMAFHYNDAPVAVSSVLSRRRRNFLVGMGQGARYHLGTKLFWMWLRERWWGPASALLLASGLATIFLSLIMSDLRWFGVWILGLCSLIAYVAFRKRSLRGGLVAAFNWLVMAEGFFKGIMMKPLPPENFYANLEMVKESRGQRLVMAADGP
jgi:glycosyltransferase involved in cell wall biosynthesis